MLSRRKTLQAFSLITSKDSNFFLFHTQKRNYVDVYMKWEKDSFYDSIDHIHKSIPLRRVISLKNCITQNPDRCISIHEVSKRGVQLEIPIKVVRFLRVYPSVFEEITGPDYNLPWFKLTPEADEIDREEQRVYELCREDLTDRLRRFILMSRRNAVPLKIIQGMLWYLGLPGDYLEHLDDSFRFVEMEEGLKGLAVEKNDKVLSVLQRNAENEGVEAMEFSLFPSKGVRLRKKIEDWLQEFQNLPYVSPYEDYTDLDPSSDLGDKRVVAFLHELLCLFVEHSAERKKLLCLKKHFGLPQKVHKAFERHPHIFYLSFRNKTCTAILKEGFAEKSRIEKHPILEVRKKYIKLMKKSGVLKNGRINRPVVEERLVEKDLDLDYSVEGNEMVADLDLDYAVEGNEIVLEPS